MRIERIEDPPGFDGSEGLLGVVVRTLEECPDGVSPVTPPSMPIQAMTIRYPAGHEITPHVHLRRYPQQGLARPVEVLIVLKGRMVADFYRSDHSLVESREVGAGDCVILCGGGHGFRMLEDCQLFEVRQGPYLGQSDKVRFDAPAHSAIPAAGG